MTERWVANPEMPKPFTLRLDSIRKAALERWGKAPISQDEILRWVRDGCPDAAGSLLNVTTRQPPIAGQGQNDPDKFLTDLLKRGAFLPA